ncbi:hypothetical protein ACF0H5_010816 [Mactra antiquata]
MSLEVEPLPRKVRLGSTPEYIPTLSKSVVINANAKSGENSARSAEKKQWGRIKDVAQIQNEQNDSDSDSDINVPRKSVGLSELQRVSKLLLRSKKVIDRVRNKYRTPSKPFSNTHAGSNNVDLPLLRTNSNLDLMNYNLTDVYKESRKKRHLKVALLQKTFLNELPLLATMSMKERLMHKIQLLQKIKTHTETNGADDTKAEQPEDPTALPDVPSSKRQSILRKSIDQTSRPVILNADIQNIINEAGKPMLPKQLSRADIEKELALSKSRHRIEDSLNLPADRLARLTLLRANVNKINVKFNSLKKGNKADGDGGKIDGFEEEALYYVPSRFVTNGMAISFFKKYSRLVVIVMSWINMIMNKQYDFEKELKSFVDIANEIEDNVMTSTMSEFGLSFDKKYFKANKEISLSSDVRKILTTRWQSRTPQMVKQVMNGLQTLRSLSEYPVDTQEKLCKVAWYQTIGAKKVIVRQGHHAESFYFILSGMAFVKKMVQDPCTGESKAQVAARLTKGHSFGEIGLLFDTLRTATVESTTPMELLVVGKEDFVRIFMKAENPDEEPEHVKFLRKVPFMKTWPTEVLKLEPGACLAHYFKRGSLITDNDRHSEWIYFIVSGTCEVLKKLKAVKGRSQREVRLKSDPMSDVILPELGMPNNCPKINTGKIRSKKRIIHPEVFKDMTEFYDSLRRKHEKYTVVKSDTKTPTSNTSFMEMPEQEDKQLQKMFLRATSARKCSITHTGLRVHFLENKQHTDGDIFNTEIKLEPLKPKDELRPISRSKLDESTPKMKSDHFRLPSREKLASVYRQASISDQNDDVFEKSTPAEDVFVMVELIHSKECFGLNTLKYVMEADEELFDIGANQAPILSLVSRGAEVIMLSKKVFLKYADQRCKMGVREQIKVYPSEEMLQDNMQLEADWTLFKENLLNEYVTKKIRSETPRSKSNMF